MEINHTKKIIGKVMNWIYKAAKIKYNLHEIKSKMS